MLKDISSFKYCGNTRVSFMLLLCQKLLYLFLDGCDNLKNQRLKSAKN